jgi:hypothetical protein
MFTRLEIEALALVVALIAGCVGLHFYNAHQQALGAQTIQIAIQQKHSQDVAEATAKEAESATKQKAADHEADVFNVAAKLDADTAGHSGDSLQHRFAAINASCVPSNSSAAVPGASASDAAGMRSDVLSRVVAAARLAASAADAAHGAGLNAERDYDALTP